jgi:hypothetical protein
MIGKAGMGSEVRFIDARPPVKGILRYTVLKNGIPIEEAEDVNLILNGARIQMAHLVAGDFTGRDIKKIAFGTNGTVPTVADTQITNPFSKNVTGFSYPEDGQVRIDWNLLVTEANGLAILEFGLLTTNGVLYSRRIRENPLHKESDISLEGNWTLIF